MTQDEKKHIDERFESLEKLVITVINNLKETIENFVKAQDSKMKEQQADICAVTATANENKIKIVALQGRVDTIEKVKAAEEKTEEKIKQDTNQIKNTGFKKWQIMAGIIALIVSLTIGILGIVF